MKSLARSSFAAAFLAGIAFLSTAWAQGPLVVSSNGTDNSATIFTSDSNGSLTLASSVPAGASNSVSVGTNPIYTTIRGDQAYIYVSNSNSRTISVIDARTLAVVQTLALTPPPSGSWSIFGIVISPSGTKGYVAVRTSLTQTVHALAVDATTGQLTETGTIIDVAQGPRGLAFSPDGSRLYVVNQSANQFTVIDTATDTVLATLALGPAGPAYQPIDVAVSPDGTRGYVSNIGDASVSVFDLTNNTLIVRTTTNTSGGTAPYGIAVSRDGAYYYAATRGDSKIHQFRASDFTEVGTGIASGGVQGDLAVSADGGYLYVASAGSDNVAAFAITPGTGVLTSIGASAAGIDPTGLATALYGNAMLATGRTFVAKRDGALTSAGSSATFTGGTLLIDAASLSVDTPIAFGTGGGTIDTNGNDATINGVLSGTGVFTKSGTGTLNLTGTNTHTGTTTVSAGTLKVNGSMAAGSAFTIASGATLGGSGTINGSVTLAAGGVVAPGNSIGTLNVGGSLTWNGSATAMPFELGASNASDKIAVTGALTKAGAGPYKFDFGGAATAGSYTLMTFASTNFSASDFSFTNLGGGLAGGFQIVGGNTLLFNVGNAPVITSAATAALSNGTPFTYQITATGGATSFGATGLPVGLTVDSTTGVISGTVNAPGATVVVTLSATNSGGITGTGSLTLQVGKIGAQIVITNLNQVYDGRAKMPTITTTPGGLTLNVLYQSVPDFNVVSAPTNPGNYRVLVSVADATYSGGALANLTISPAVTTVPAKTSAAAGGTATFTMSAIGPGLTYQWSKNGVPISGATGPTLTLSNVQSSDVALYTATLTGGGVAITTAAVPLELTFVGKIAGAAMEVGSDIKHPNGNVYDQVLLTGASAAVKADAGQVTRVSYVDLTNDIVQLEFSGAGVMAIVLDNASGPAPAANYSQPDVAYMKGHATITITGADNSTNLGIFAVGTATAVNQALFRSGVTYDGFADAALVAIASADGKFGAVRTGDASYFATKGLTGVYAPGVTFSGPLYVGDVSGSDAASAVLVTGAAGDAQINGGDLLQPNNGAVIVSGMTALKFVAGTKADGTTLPAQANRARLLRDGVDVTSLLVK